VGADVSVRPKNKFEREWKFMFIYSVKLPNRKFLIDILIAFLAIIFLILIGQYIKKINTVQESTAYNFSNIKTNEDRINLLKQFGWEVEPKALEIVEIQIPEEFDDVYLNYNRYQKEIGLDLEKYKGKRAIRYTYKVLNHPRSDKDEVRANILIYNNQLIAGDIMTPAIDGFMHSLIYNHDLN